MTDDEAKAKTKHEQNLLLAYRALDPLDKHNFMWLVELVGEADADQLEELRRLAARTPKGTPVEQRIRDGIELLTSTKSCAR